MRYALVEVHGILLYHYIRYFYQWHNYRYSYSKSNDINEYNIEYFVYM